MKEHRYKNTKSMSVGLTRHFKQGCKCKHILPYVDYKTRIIGYLCKECQDVFVMTATALRHEFQIPYSFQKPQNVIIATRTETGWERTS